MSGFLKVLGIAIVGVFLGSWGAAYLKLPPAMTEPTYAGPFLSARSDAILRASCFDCHSNEAHYPGYTLVPGATQVIARDVLKGRKELNFSEWGTIGPNKKARLLREIRGEIESGEMPPMIYALTHPAAKLSDEAKARLLADLSAAGATTAAPYKTEAAESSDKKINLPSRKEAEKREAPAEHGEKKGH